MFVKNPEYTLEEDAQGLFEEGQDKGGLEWTYIINVQGDDGIQYGISCHISRYPNLNHLFPALGVTQGADLWVLSVRQGKGKVVQSPGAPVKIADFPKGTVTAFQHYPFGSLTIKKTKDQVAVDLGDAHLLCKDDKTWHLSVEDKEKGIKVELVHYGVGSPTWYYDKEKLEVWTPHCIAGGYFWSGHIEGELTIEGRKVAIKGRGARQRCYMLDLSSVEAGAWQDWVWFHFDEIFGCLDELKLTKYKVWSLYLVDEKRYLQDGSFNIEHPEWAYLRQIGTFIPTRYRVTIETEAGVLEIAANVTGCFTWDVIGEVPESPFVTLDWDKLEGTFTYKDGRKRTLTNGLGGSLVQQWKPYPNVLEWFIPEIVGAK